MTSRALRRIMHLVLATAATDAAIACGGSVAGIGDSDPGESSSSSGGSSSSGSSSGGSSSGGSSSGGSSSSGSSSGGVDGGLDVKADVKPDAVLVDVVKQDVVVTSCKVGQTDPADAFCCKSPTDPGCSGSGGGDGPEECRVNCVDVCKAVAGNADPNSWCYWTGPANARKIQYYCGMCGVGRIPGDAQACMRGASVAERLAMQAYYEGVSVVAFRRLAQRLEQEKAPRELVRRVRRAMNDERRHARMFRRLAEGLGAEVSPVELDARSLSLFDLALENAREGCVRETYGALVALHQARHAETPELRAAFAAIADDEIAHAALSWELARWFDTRLGAAERARVDAARADAMVSLREAAVQEHDAIDDVLGVPGAQKARALYGDLFERIAAA